MKFDEAAVLLHEAIPSLDGIWLGRALLMLGDCLYRQPQKGRLFDVEKSIQQLKEALKMLNQARDILNAQGDQEWEAYCATLIKSIENDLST